MKNLIYFIAIIIVIACNSTSKIAENKLQQKTILPDSIYRFTVSFISIGSGTDSEARQQFSRFIQQFNKENNITINTEITNWGREGEMDYCLKLNELNKQQQDRFIAETKKILKNSTLVRYNENSICEYKEKRKE